MNKLAKTISPETIDADNPEWTDEMFANAKTAKELAKTEPIFAKLIEAHKNGTLTVGTEGWQTRINDALKAFVAEHS